MLARIIAKAAREVDFALFGYKYHTIRNFRRAHGYPLNLQSPKTFSEKIQWIKLYGHPERFSEYVDKYAVREFVKKRIGECYLIPMVGVYDRVDDIDYSTLPDSFVMKATHGSGWNIILEDKKLGDWNRMRETMRRWVAMSFYKHLGEANYKPLKGRVIIEALLKDPSGDLKDYKIFCFGGTPRSIQVDSDRMKAHKRDMYDLDWNKIPVRFAYDNLPLPAVKPDKLAEMIELAQKLSQGFPFVRVDLYCTGSRVYFGELTFTPESGFGRITPVAYDFLWGELLDLQGYSTRPTGAVKS